MKMRPAPNAASQAADQPRIGQQQVVEQLEHLHQRITRIRRLVESDEDYLEIVGETNIAQARLKQLALIVISDRMESCLSSLSYPELQRDKLIDQVIHALSGFHNNSE